MKLFYFLSLGLLLSLSPLAQADTPEAETEEQLIEEQLIDEQLIDEQSQTLTREQEKEKAALPQEQKEGEQEQELSLQALAGGSAAAIAGLSALTLAVFNIRDIHKGSKAPGVKVKTFYDFIKVYQASAALLYTGYHALKTARKVLIKT